jgi:RNA polymerase sigma factor (sigma-70 family)
MTHPDEGLVGAGPPQPERRTPISPNSFDDFFRGQYRQTVRFVMRVGATPEEAEDAAQTAMAEVFRCWASLTNPAAWARTAAVRTYINTVSRDRVGRRLTERMVQESVLSSEVDETEQHQWVVQQLRGLPAAQLEAMAFAFDGYQPIEIAALTGKDAQTIRSNLREARKRLRRIHDMELAPLLAGSDDTKREA